METLVIGLGHRMRSGKDTAANAITRAYPEVKRYGFADELKREVELAAFCAGSMAKLFDDRRDELPEWVKYDENAPVDDPLCPNGKQRTLLQWWGGDYRRGEDPLYWIHKLSIRIRKDAPAIAIVSDLRYLNEFWWIKGAGGVTVNIVRVDMSSLSSHQSEHDLDGAPYNHMLAIPDGQVETLERAAVQLFEKILKEKENENVPRVSRFTSYGSLGGR